MRSLRKIIILFLTLAITTSCDKANVLTEYSQKDTDEALFYESQKLMDALDWDGAIQILTTDLSSGFRSTTKVKERLMYAYGGKCGISFFDLINNLKNMNSSDTMFEFSLQLFSQTSVDMASCDNSLTVLHELGATAADRTSEQNVFAAILGLTRMAVTIHTKMDTENSGLGDGVVDAGWDACAVSSAANRLSDAEMNRIATGVGLIFENLAALTDALSSGSGDATSAFDSAKTLCETPIALPAIGAPTTYGAPGGTTWVDLGLPASPSYPDFGLPADIADPLTCTNTVDANVSAKMRRILRRMISSSTMGFGSCNIASFTPSFNVGVTPPTASVAANCCPALVAP